MRKFWHSKWFVVAILLTIVLVSASILLTLRIKFEEREDAVLRYFSEQEGMPETFTQLKNLQNQARWFYVGGITVALLEGGATEK